MDKITIYLQNPDASCWPGVLLALHQLVKNFEYVRGVDIHGTSFSVPFHGADDL